MRHYAHLCPFALRIFSVLLMIISIFLEKKQGFSNSHSDNR
uniref:Uncharacterized protein n=1 Tax=Aegilops tauschii subsp. strangulata TaxID=200361 RepID=A0A453BV79_AEGTS